MDGPGLQVCEELATAVRLQKTRFKKSKPLESSNALKVAAKSGRFEGLGAFWAIRVHAVSHSFLPIPASVRTLHRW